MFLEAQCLVVRGDVAGGSVPAGSPGCSAAGCAAATVELCAGAASLRSSASALRWDPGLIAFLVLISCRLRMGFAAPW